ncbi:MAG: hypothetical protein K1W37_14010 [Lachnospiraceae bacterium]
MDFFINNWYVMVAVTAILAGAGYSVYIFIKKSSTEQLKSLKEWMLWAVTKAEKELGSGTGKLKLRYVYDMFITKFPWLRNTISFEIVSMMVDDALEEMRIMLERNKAVKDFVSGFSEE